MTLGDVVEAAAARRKSLVYHAHEDGDLAERFAARNVDVSFNRIPPDGPEPFVTVYEHGEFQAAVSLADLEAFLAPPHPGRRAPGSLSPAYRALYELFDDTVFASLSRRQLLAASREIEDRAWRTGRGALHAGFQSIAAFDAQKAVYRRLATDTSLDVHVYVVPSADASEFASHPVTVHQRPHPEVGRYWFLAFDSAVASQNCALVAEQTGENAYDGVWTYDRDLVATALDSLVA